MEVPFNTEFRQPILHDVIHAKVHVRFISECYVHLSSICSHEY
jgi:hypothetical protein